MNQVQYLMWYYNLETTTDIGREVYRMKDMFFRHTGIIVGKNKSSGKLMVIHNHPESGVQLVTYEEFCSGKPGYYTDAIHDSWEKVVLRAFEKLHGGVSYDAWRENCQHVSSYARTGEPSSAGKAGFLALMSVLVLISLASRS